MFDKHYTVVVRGRLSAILAGSLRVGKTQSLGIIFIHFVTLIG